MGNIFKKALRKVYDFYFSLDDNTSIADKDGNIRETKYFYDDFKEIYVSSENIQEGILNYINNYELPFEIVIDDDGNITEVYSMLGSPVSWTMKKELSYLNDHSDTIVIKEEFQDYTGYKAERTIIDTKTKEFNYLDVESGKMINNSFEFKVYNGALKRIVDTADTRLIKEKYNKQIIANDYKELYVYVEFKKYWNDRRKVFFKLSNDNNDFVLSYITSFNPSLTDGELNRDKNHYDNNFF